MLILFCRFARALLGGLLCSAVVGQIPRDILPGASAEAVVRAYGWPKGRAYTGNQEIWIYEKFQVTLVGSRVVNAAALPMPLPIPRTPTAHVANLPTPETPARILPVQPAAVPSSPRVAPGGRKAVEKKSLPILHEPTPVVRTAPQASVGVMSSARGEGPTARSATRDQSRAPVAQKQPPVSSGLFGWSTPLVWGVFAVMTVLVVLKSMAVGRRRWRGVTATNVGGVESASRREPANWKEEIADRLARSTALEHSAQAANESAAPTRPEVALREAALQSGDLSRELLLALEWKRFEQVVMLYFNASGVRAECTKTGADGGIDVLLYRSGEPAPASYVQCKAYAPKKPVVAAEVRSLYGVMAAAKVGQGVFVTTSEFGPAARTFAGENNIEAIDGVAFLARFAALAPDARAAIIARVTEGDFTTPTCATHDVKMVMRVNGKDGSTFWACARPRCRRTLRVRSDAAGAN